MSTQRLVIPAFFTGLLVAGSAIAQQTEATSGTPPLLPLLMRWMHILAAITMLGGTLFLRTVVVVATRQALDPDAGKGLRAAIGNRWKKFVPWLTTALIVSGLYNYMVLRSGHANDSPYHMLFGLKFLLALVVFGLAMTLLSSESWSAKIRQSADKWLSVLLALAITVVLIAGYMKVMP